MTTGHKLRAPVFAGLRTDIDPAPEREPLLSADLKEALLDVDGIG
ncbi:MAG: hypothetical protein WDO18_04515 [Acidobacteriota bacterium]